MYCAASSLVFFQTPETGVSVGAVTWGESGRLGLGAVLHVGLYPWMPGYSWGQSPPVENHCSRRLGHVFQGLSN